MVYHFSNTFVKLLNSYPFAMSGKILVLDKPNSLLHSYICKSTDFMLMTEVT